MTEQTLPFYGDGRPMNGVDIIDIQPRHVEANGIINEWSEAYIPKHTAARTTGIGGKLLTIIDVDEDRKAAVQSSSFGMIQPIVLSDEAVISDVDEKIEGFTSSIMPALKSSEGVLYEVDPIVFTRSNTHAGFYFLGQATYQSSAWLLRSLKDFHDISSRSIVATDSGALPSLANISQGTEPKVYEYASPVPLYDDEDLEASITISFSQKRQKYYTKLAPKNPELIPDGDELIGFIDFGNLVRDAITGALRFDEMNWTVKALDKTSRQLVGLVMTSCSSIEQIPVNNDDKLIGETRREISPADNLNQGLTPKQPRPFN